jgi:hypothetical protein
LKPHTSLVHELQNLLPWQQFSYYAMIHTKFLSLAMQNLKVTIRP